MEELKRIKFTMRFTKDILDWLNSKGSLSDAIDMIIKDRYEEEKYAGGNCSKNENIN